MFLTPLHEGFQDVVRVTALCDPNAKRAATVARLVDADIPIYTSFDQMLAATDPDGVIVSSRDCTHAEYIIKALAAGKHVFSEKPVCTTAAQCQALRKAAEQSEGRCLVTHNKRYSMSAGVIREVLRSGLLGEIYFMRFEETLDRCHGADYFRRWHRHMDQSGGLLIHKASHHFDILNWWAGATPLTVSAQGRLAFYGHNGPFRSARCRGCPHSANCALYLDIASSESYRQLYLEAESEDGYHRDGCVFDPVIDIQDQMNVLIGYENGIQVSYSLTAYSPYESETVIIEGSKGRLEYHAQIDTGPDLGGQVFPGIADMANEDLKLYMTGCGVEGVPLARAEGGHGGADPKLRAEFFRRDWALPPTDEMATLEDAIQAVLVGAAANTSMATGETVAIQEQA